MASKQVTSPPSSTPQLTPPPSQTRSSRSYGDLDLAYFTIPVSAEELFKDAFELQQQNESEAQAADIDDAFLDASDPSDPALEPQSDLDELGEMEEEDSNADGMGEFDGHKEGAASVAPQPLPSPLPKSGLSTHKTQTRQPASKPNVTQPRLPTSLKKHAAKKSVRTGSASKRQDAPRQRPRPARHASAGFLLEEEELGAEWLGEERLTAGSELLEEGEAALSELGAREQKRRRLEADPGEAQ